jgi:hypothetical protein
MTGSFYYLLRFMLAEGRRSIFRGASGNVVHTKKITGARMAESGENRTTNTLMAAL